MKLKGEKQLMRFEYDFAKLGGAQGTIVIPQAAGNTLEGCKILNAYAVVETALASGGTPTLTFGVAGNEDKYMADTYANLVAEGVGKAALLIGADATDIPVLEIGTADLTAGKIALYLEVLA